MPPTSAYFGSGALFAQLLKDEVAVLNMLLLHRPEVFQQSAGMRRVISVTI
jgi:hypothetical protein